MIGGSNAHALSFKNNTTDSLVLKPGVFKKTNTPYQFSDLFGTSGLDSNGNIDVPAGDGTSPGWSSALQLQPNHQGGKYTYTIDDTQTDDDSDPEIWVC